MRSRVGVLVVAVVAVFLPRLVPAQVAISDDNITVTGDDVLTMGHATPLYARGTGSNNPSNRLVKLGDSVLVNNNSRGLTLSIFDGNGHVSSTNYDTFGSGSDSDALAGVLAALGNGQIGVLTSADAFEQEITAALRAEASRLGLIRLATKPGSADDATWRHPYVAIFYGSPDPTPNRQAVEILQPNAEDAPYAILATWLMDDGFVGQALSEARPDPPCFNTTERFINCGNGTVTDTVTGLIYLENANCFGQQDWPTANESAASLSSGECGLSDGSRPRDWRLQTKEEWEGIVRSACLPPTIIGNASDSSTSCHTNSGWASGVEWSGYWSSTTDSTSTAFAWKAFLFLGFVSGDNKPALGHVWPVRGGPLRNRRLAPTSCPTGEFVTGFNTAGKLTCAAP